MMTIKNAADIQKMQAAGRVVEGTLALMGRLAKPGVSTLELDRAAEEYIRSQGATPSFLHYNGYPKSICTSVNEQVVHGIPGHYRLKEGDIVGVDVGAKLDASLRVSSLPGPDIASATFPGPCRPTRKPMATGWYGS